ncbi:hypothetical protein B6U67_00855 [Methanosarcinales archaeon ex4484_138]|nr:MAG: hypothetical protein B6U67_00855 [Methanosarcinales archaeon ex4484_138]
MSKAVDCIKTILEDNWNSSNTANRTPFITPIEDYKRADLDNDGIFLYESSTTTRRLGVPQTTWEKDTVVSIDVRTIKDVDQLELMRDEIERILKAKWNAPCSNFHFISLDLKGTELTDKSTGLWRFVYDVTLQVRGEL